MNGTLLLWLAECAVKSVLVMGLALVSARLMRRCPAAWRHLVLTLGCLCALLLPVLELAVPGRTVVVLAGPMAVSSRDMGPGGSSATASRDTLRAGTEGQPAATDFSVVPGLVGVTAPVSDATVSTVAGLGVRDESRGGRAALQRAHSRYGIGNSVGALTPYPVSNDGYAGEGEVAVLVWGGVCLVLAANAGRALLALRRMKRKSLLARPSWTSRLSERLDPLRPWQLRISRTERPPVAMTWGIWKPVVMLPRASLEWPRQRFEAVLLHELAHVRRLDGLTQWISAAACALYWFNPAAWLCARAMRSEAEAAADDCVLRSGVRATEYASTLVEIASELGGHRQFLTPIGVSFMKPSKIEARVEAILDRKHQRRGLTTLGAVSAMLGAGLIVLPISILRASLQSEASAHKASTSVPVVPPPLRDAGQDDSGQRPAVTVRPLPPGSKSSSKIASMAPDAGTDDSGEPTSVTVQPLPTEPQDQGQDKDVAAMQKKIAELQAELAVSEKRLAEAQAKLDRRGSSDVDEAKLRKLLEERVMARTMKLEAEIQAKMALDQRHAKGRMEKQATEMKARAAKLRKLMEEDMKKAKHMSAGQRKALAAQESALALQLLDLRSFETNRIIQTESPRKAVMAMEKAMEDEGLARSEQEGEIQGQIRKIEAEKVQEAARLKALGVLSRDDATSADVIRKLREAGAVSADVVAAEKAEIAASKNKESAKLDLAKVQAELAKAKRLYEVGAIGRGDLLDAEKAELDAKMAQVARQEAVRNDLQAKERAAIAQQLNRQTDAMGKMERRGAMLRESEVRLKAAEDRMARVMKLNRKGFASDRELKKAEAEVRAARAQVARYKGLPDEDLFKMGSR